MRVNSTQNPAIILAGVACENGMRMLANEILQASKSAKLELERASDHDVTLRGMLSIHKASVVVFRMKREGALK